MQKQASTDLDRKVVKSITEGDTLAVDLETAAAGQEIATGDPDLGHIVDIDANAVHPEAAPNRLAIVTADADMVDTGVPPLDILVLDQGVHQGPVHIDRTGPNLTEIKNQIPFENLRMINQY